MPQSPPHRLAEMVGAVVQTLDAHLVSTARSNAAGALRQATEDEITTHRTLHDLRLLRSGDEFSSSTPRIGLGAEKP
jgi:hypothetical protein